MPVFDRDGVTLQFEDEGSGEPVILIHGFPFSADLWTPQRAALVESYRVVTPHLRGFGGSDPLPSTPSLDVFADDIVALMDELGIGQATVGGLSMGGYVVMALLRRHPARVRGAMLVSTKSTPDTDAGKQGRNDMIALVQNEGTRAVADKMLPQLLTERTRNDDPDLVSFVHAMMESAPSVAGIVGAASAMRDRPDSTPTLAAATVPALIIVGDDDKLTTLDDAKAMHAVHPNAEIVVVPDAAHLVNLEQPAAVNEALLAFLQRTTGE